MIKIVKFALLAMLIITLPRLLELSDKSNELVVLLLFNYVLNGTALIFGLHYLKYYLFPSVIGVAIMNILGYYLAVIYVPFSEFQAGLFNYEVLRYISVGFVVFYAVYFYFIRRLRFSLSLKDESVTYTKNELAVISLILFLFSFLPIPITDFENIMQYFSLALLLICYFRFEYDLIRSSMLLFILVYILIKVVLSTLIFSVIYVYFFCLIVFVIAGYSKRSMRIQFVFFSALVGIFAYSFSSIKMDFRTEEASKLSSQEKLTNIFLGAKSSSRSLENDNSHSVLWRLSYSASVFSHIMEQTPRNVPFWNGSSYEPLFYKFIPRFIWSNKPKENMGQNFGHAYNLLAYDNTSTSMNAPILVEAYFNYGIVGIIIVSIVMGLFMSHVFVKFNIIRNNENNVLNIFSISMVSVYSTQWESNLSMYLGKIVVLYFVIKAYSLTINIVKNK